MIKMNEKFEQQLKDMILSLELNPDSMTIKDAYLLSDSICDFEKNGGKLSKRVDSYWSMLTTKLLKIEGISRKVV